MDVVTYALLKGKIDKVSGNLPPAPTPEDAGKVPTVQPDGSYGLEEKGSSAPYLISETPPDNPDNKEIFWIDPNEKSEQGDNVVVNAEFSEYITYVKPEIAKAIQEKGGTVLPEDTFGSYPDRIRSIPNKVEPIEDLPSQTTLIAIEQPASVQLNWEDTKAAGYLVIKKKELAPINPSDGEVIYDGTNLTCIDNTKEIGVIYYRIYPYNSKHQYQSEKDGSVVKLNIIDRTQMKQLKDLNLEDKVIFGTKNNGELISWVVKDTKEAKTKGIVSLGTEFAVLSGQFDAPENNKEKPNPIDTRKNQGNNRWSLSNARQWLNSTVADQWYQPRHEYDMPPNYANKPGFLSGFNAYEQSILLNKENKSFLATVDGGGYEIVQDKVWLISSYEAGCSLTPIDGDHVFNGMETQDQRRFESNYWMRTLNDVNNPSIVRIVASGGSQYGYGAYGGIYALRPFVNLSGNTYVAWNDNLQAYVLGDNTERVYG